MATLADMAAENANIQQQLDEWRAARTAAGEDASDWEAFRQHAMAIGAPDPGAEAPTDL
jgi:hypothetical protein